MNVLETTIDAAATARITRLVVEDEISRPMREKVEAAWPGSSIAYLVTCPYCVSVWAGFAVQILPRPARYALAMSAMALAGRWVTEAVEGAVQ